MTNLLYNRAPNFWYRDKEGWTASAVELNEDNDPRPEVWECDKVTWWGGTGSGSSAISDVPGYRVDFLESGDGRGINCDGLWGDREGEGVMKYTKDKLNDHWNPLAAQYKGVRDMPEDSFQKKKVINNIVNCCTNERLFQNSDREACGSYLEGGITGDCGVVLNDWCMKEDNILDNKCKVLIPESTKLQRHLRNVCPAKQNNSKYDMVCPCFYSDNFYEDLATEITKTWMGPNYKLERKPKCIYPKCNASIYKDSNDKTDCGVANFASCSQNANFELTASTVKSVPIKQQCNIYFDTAYNSTYSKGGTSTVVNPSPEKTASEKAAANKKAKEEKERKDKEEASSKFSPNTIMMIVFLILVICGAGGYYWFILKPKKSNMAPRRDYAKPIIKPYSSYPQHNNVPMGSPSTGDTGYYNNGTSSNYITNSFAPY
jgi:hypothetical protein